MKCDKCGKRIYMGDENWQRFTVSDTEVTLCEKCFVALWKWIGMDDEEEE